MREAYRLIAYVVKAHGKRGEVVTQGVGGLPPLLRRGMRVAVVPPELPDDRWQTVDHVVTSDRGQLVSFSSVDTLNDAEHLVGRSILAVAGDLPENFAFLQRASLVGRTVVDKNTGIAAVITEVMSGPAQDVWCLDIDGHEVLIPVIPDVVSHVPNEGFIEIRVPKGLGWPEVGDRP